MKVDNKMCFDDRMATRMTTMWMIVSWSDKSRMRESKSEKEKKREKNGQLKHKQIFELTMIIAQSPTNIHFVTFSRGFFLSCFCRRFVCYFSLLSQNGRMANPSKCRMSFGVTVNLNVNGIWACDAHWEFELGLE